MAVKERRQHFMNLALDRMEAVARCDPKVQERYQKYCQGFAVMVGQNGLAQTVAFIEDKSIGDDEQGKAYLLVLEDIAQILGGDTAGLSSWIAKMDAAEYMLATERVLDAWVYFKRFSKSVLATKDNSGFTSVREEENDNRA